MAGTTAGLYSASSSRDQAPELALVAAAERGGWSREELRARLLVALPLATTGEIEAVVRGWQQERRGSGSNGGR